MTEASAPVLSASWLLTVPVPTSTPIRLVPARVRTVPVTGPRVSTSLALTPVRMLKVAPAPTVRLLVPLMPSSTPLVAWVTSKMPPVTLVAPA